MAKVKAKVKLGTFIKAGGKCRKGWKKVRKGRGKNKRTMCVRRKKR